MCFDILAFTIKKMQYGTSNIILIPTMIMIVITIVIMILKVMMQMYKCTNRFAEKHGFKYEVEERRMKAPMKAKSYADKVIVFIIPF